MEKKNFPIAILFRLDRDRMSIELVTMLVEAHSKEEALGIAMGVYYQVACDEREERIDPGDIDDLGIKAGPIAHPQHPFGPVVVFAMLHRWQAPVRLVNDSSDDPGYFEYTNVTKEVLQAYNERYDTDFVFTGKFTTE